MLCCRVPDVVNGCADVDYLSLVWICAAYGDIARADPHIAVPTEGLLQIGQKNVPGGRQCDPGGT